MRVLLYTCLVNWDQGIRLIFLLCSQLNAIPVRNIVYILCLLSNIWNVFFFFFFSSCLNIALPSGQNFSKLKDTEDAVIYNFGGVLF